MQSHDYVPGTYGWKVNTLTGDFEFNLSRMSVGGLPEQPQMVTVTAGEWAASELPTSAIEHYAFIGAEVFKIPAEYRDSSQITTQDESYEPGFANIRTTLTYQRPETAAEVAVRVKASRAAEYSFEQKGDKLTFFRNGVPRVELGNLGEADETPFTVRGGQVFLDQGFIDAGKFSNSGTLRTNTNAAGKTVLAGIGAGLRCMCEGGYTGTRGDKAEKAEVKIGTPFAFEGGQVMWSQALVDASKLPSDWSVKVGTNAAGQLFCSGIGLGNSAKSHSQNSCEAQLDDRIKTLEACVAQLNSELGRLVVAVSGLVSENAKQ